METIKNAELKTNVIYCGDCLDVLKRIPDNSVDLIYLDPPFFSQKNYENFWVKDGKTRLSFTDTNWQEMKDKLGEQELREIEEMNIRWKGGKSVGGLYIFVAYLKSRVIQCKRILKETGSIYLHCDYHASHYIKMMLDEVFGYKNFRNELVWCYSSASSPKVRQFGRKHDIIFWYARGDSWIFNKDDVRDKYSEASLSMSGKKKSFHDGSKTICSLNKNGKFPDDWFYIPTGVAMIKERLGYPTQKPEKLLERIIKASSNEGDIVLDCFCGCGTTSAVAYNLKRKFIGIDISRMACEVIKERIKKIGYNPEIIGGLTIDELKVMKPNEFADLMIRMLGGLPNIKKTNDKGIDGTIEFGTIPIQIKRWGNKVGRPEIDKFKTAIEREHKIKGVIVAFDFSRDCYGEVARIKQENNIEIELKKVADVIDKE